MAKYCRAPPAKLRTGPGQMAVVGICKGNHHAYVDVPYGVSVGQAKERFAETMNEAVGESWVQKIFHLQDSARRP